jgi:anti-sigma regulatory factor (Ser/Thr protein kinase)
MGRTVSGVREASSTVATRERPATLESQSYLNSQSHRDPQFRADGGSGAVCQLEAPAGTVSRALPADLTAVREARRVVQQVLGTWRAEDIFDDVVLVASELVANALRHGVQVEQPRVRPMLTSTDPAGVRISLVSTGSHVICAVTDPSEAPPVRRSVDPMAGSGRGLQLVESLSLCWGWTVLDEYGDGVSTGAVQGKSVWAIFPLDVPVRPERVAGAA